jgi:hypothetical protein
MFNKRQACDKRLILLSGGVGASVLLEVRTPYRSKTPAKSHQGLNASLPPIKRAARVSHCWFGKHPFTPGSLLPIDNDGQVLWTDLGQESLRKEQVQAQSLSHQTKGFRSRSPAAQEVDTFEQRITRNLWAFRRRRRPYRTVEIYCGTEPCPSRYQV